MDDVRDVKIWDDVSRYLPDDRNGSCVLLTTRMINVANHASYEGDIHRMRFLDEHESRCLLYSRVFGEIYRPYELRHFGDEIARSCKGLPSMLVAIADHLCIVDQIGANWRRVADVVSHELEDDDQILSGILVYINSIQDKAIGVRTKSKDELQPLKDLQPGGTPGESIVVGMKRDYEEIMKRVCGASSKLEIFAIVGMGGIGKTTLAARVYNNVNRSHFDIFAWTTVSHEYSFRQVILDLVRCAEPEEGKWCVEYPDNYLYEFLYKRLKGRRYFIVLDDVWDVKILDLVTRYLPREENGSRVLMTTQLIDVANHVSSSNHIHRMRFLNEDESWSLLSDRVFGEKHCPNKLRHIGCEIAGRCKGLPLALVAIANHLSTIDESEKDWRHFADDVRSDATVNDKILKILGLSYNHLPHHLRPCFLYMGMFPEDCVVPATKLAHLWAAEGFLQRSDGYESSEEIATKYLEDLIGRSLILVSHRNSQNVVTKCKINVFFKELCLRLSHKEKFFYVVNHQQDVPTEGVESYLRLVIHPNILRTHLDILHDEVHSNSRTHSLLCMGDDFNGLGPKTQFNFLDYKLLRVLDLLAIHMSMFPLEVSNLVSLRYLAASFTGTLHPDISKLWNLLTIVHRDPSSSHKDSVLPVEIWMVPNLRHVYVPAACLPSPPCGSKGYFALQTLVEVINLSFGIQVLDKMKGVKKLVVSYDVELKSFKGWSGHRLRNLARLNQLQKLKMRVINPDTPTNVSYPWNLALPQSLKSLTLSGCRIPWERLTIVGALPNLEVLKLRNNACQGEKWEPMEGEYCNLKYLELQDLEFVHWIADNFHFPCLQRLAVKLCHQLKRIPYGIGYICSLERIEVVDCHPRVVASAKYIRDEQYDRGNSDLEINIYYDGKIEERRAKPLKKQY